uniref:Uncharacterized protein n=1 Tax=Pan troglodytes TaxID=9598 RepID=H2REM7_PANTR
MSSCPPVETGSRGALRLRGGAPGSAAGFRASIWGAAHVPLTCRARAPGIPPPPRYGPRCPEPDARHGWGSGSNAGYRGPDRAGRPAQDREGRSSSPVPPPRLKAMTSQARKQNGGALIDTVDWTREAPDSDPVMSMQKSQKPQTTVGQ